MGLFPLPLHSLRKIYELLLDAKGWPYHAAETNLVKNKLELNNILDAARMGGKYSPPYTNAVDKYKSLPDMSYISREPLPKFNSPAPYDPHRSNYFDLFPPKLGFLKFLRGQGKFGDNPTDTSISNILNPKPDIASLGYRRENTYVAPKEQFVYRGLSDQYEELSDEIFSKVFPLDSIDFLKSPKEVRDKWLFLKYLQNNNKMNNVPTSTTIQDLLKPKDPILGIRIPQENNFDPEYWRETPEIANILSDSPKNNVIDFLKFLYDRGKI